MQQGGLREGRVLSLHIGVNGTIASPVRNAESTKPPPGLLCPHEVAPHLQAADWESLTFPDAKSASRHALCGYATIYTLKGVW